MNFGPYRPMKLQECRFHVDTKELLIRLASSMSFSITQLFQITRCPCAIFFYVLIIHYEIMPFGVSKVTVSWIILKWLTEMDVRLIIWADCETLRKTMPMCFKESFGENVVRINFWKGVSLLTPSIQYMTKYCF